MPLSHDVYIDSSVTREEIEYLQKALAGERDGGEAKIDSIYKRRQADWDLLEVRRSIFYWQFKHTTKGEWLLVSHGDWYS